MIAKEQFFMESTMGAYAQRKLNELDENMKFIENNDCSYPKYQEVKKKILSDDTKKFIDSIGEPIIKKYLTNRLNKLLGDDIREIKNLLEGRSDEFIQKLEQEISERRKL